MGNTGVGSGAPKVSLNLLRSLFQVLDGRGRNLDSHRSVKEKKGLGISGQRRKISHVTEFAVPGSRLSVRACSHCVFGHCPVQNHQAEKHACTHTTTAQWVEVPC